MRPRANGCWRLWLKRCLVQACLLGALSSRAMTNAYAADAVSVAVPGTADPWLAGMPNGSTDTCDPICDVVPAQSPVLVPVGALDSTVALVITATGATAQDPNFPLVGPNGVPNSILGHGPVNGMSQITTPFSSLLGVFLDANAPNLSPAPLPTTDSTHPGLKQVFFIGSSATVYPPSGATRLFLGTADSNGWHNNIGSLMVRVGFNVTSSEIIGVFNTGVDNSGNLLPSGAVDSHYRIIGQFTAIGTPPVFPVGSVPVSMPGIGTQISGAASAYVARNEEWVPDGPSSKWLSPFVNTEGPPDLYLYETTFDLNGVDPNSAMLTGSWTVDDWAWMFVNGHLVSELPCYGTFLQLYGIQVYPGFSCSANHDFTVSNYFVSGTNKLDFVVWNGGGDGTGLRVEIKGMVNVDSLVTFSAQSSTYRTLNDTTGCPAGSAGKFTFTASLTNKPSSPSIADLSVRVATLTNGNVLLDAQTNAVLGGAGAVMPIPKQGMYSDGVLGPGELVDVPFIICLQTQQAFQFFVDVFASR